MALSWRARRRWSLVILLAGLPLYIAAAVTLVAWFDRPGLWLELAIYVALGLLWALPFRWIFSGVARPEPPEETRPAPRERPGPPAH